MHRDVEFDPAKAVANRRKHGVGFAHAEQALRDPLALTIEDPDAEGEQRLARISHRFPAAAPDLSASPALRLVRVLDVLSKYACAPEPARALS